MSLVSYSNDVYGDIQPDGSVVPRYQGVLAWAFIYRGVALVAVGAARPSDQPLPAPVQNCDHVSLVDATSGAYLQAYDDCAGTTG